MLRAVSNETGKSEGEVMRYFSAFTRLGSTHLADHAKVIEDCCWLDEIFQRI
jgi:hypothetical protein